MNGVWNYYAFVIVIVVVIDVWFWIADAQHCKESGNAISSS